MTEGELTGRRRYRKTMLGFVVEVEYTTFEPSGYPNGFGLWRCKWRKARRSDLLDAPTIPNSKDQHD